MKRLASRLSRVSDVFAPLRDCLDRSSVVGRHALRYGLVVAAGVAIDKGFDRRSATGFRSRRRWS